MINQFEEMKNKIDESKVVSFDVFDTLIKRIVNTPETVFDVVGRQYGIMGFEKKRHEYQMSASQKVERELGIPHADMNHIYEYISENDKADINWMDVKNTEVQMELDCLVRNNEMYDIYRYAKESGKKVIITSDMYLTKEQMVDILTKCGYDDYDSIYISSDVHATKYNGDIFRLVCKEEKVEAQDIVHIGDNVVSDIDNAKKFGLNAVQYVARRLSDEVKPTNVSAVDMGAAEVLLKENDFWYNLGVYVGGPLYLGLSRWFREKTKDIGCRKVYFLARDGYNLHNIFKDDEEYDSQYLYMSRRALLLAGIDKVDEAALEILPPFTLGQTVREVLGYLGVTDACGKNLHEAGIPNLEYVVKTMSDIQKVKKLYVINEKDFLQKCDQERANAKKYFQSMGFYDEDSVVFDCGWNGSSQYLLDRFLKCTGYDKQNHFLYVGIMDTKKSRNQLRDKKYDTYLFDCDNNRWIQDKVKDAIVLFELFFGSPEESVYLYDENGIVFEKTGIDNSYKHKICQGVTDFVNLTFDFTSKYNIDISTNNAIAGIIRLINKPTMEEAKTIGDLKNVDGFVNQEGLVKYVAKLDVATYEKYPNIEIYWLQGLLKRDDIEEELKNRLQRDKGAVLNNSSLKSRIIKGVKKVVRKIIPRKASAPSVDAYKKWIERNEQDIYSVTKLEYNPLFTFVVPVYNVIDEQLEACIDSIIGQTYTNWELWLVDDCSTWKNVKTTLQKYEKLDKINVHYRSKNGHISKATNDGIERAKGEFIAFMDCDDVIAPNALYEFARKLNDNKELDFIYSDEDKLSEDGKRRHSPFFKPDWSPDTFMSLMYTNHLAIYRTELVKKVGGLRSEFNGTQDYDFTLRFMEQSDNKRVGHIPKVLYYWRERGESIASNPEAKPYVFEAIKKAKEEALERRGLKGTIEYVGDMYQYRVVYENIDNDKVSIIIPSKDNTKLLFQCLKSIKKYTKYTNYEIIVVDNGSGDENKKLISEYVDKNGIIYHYEKMTFNFSKMCNIGASLATGKYLLFLNDDIEITNAEWLSRMVGHASVPYVGAVGAKLFYPGSNTIQHAGVTNLKIGPSHSFIGFSDSPIYYFGRNRMDYNFLAVTAACLVVSKEKFDEVDGFDEELTVGYNDVDLCFKLYEAGYYNVLRNDVTMYHHESASRGSDDIDEAKKQRLLTERKRLYDKHPKLEGVDPFYNINLVTNGIDFSINNAGDASNKRLGRLHWKPSLESSFTAVIDNIDNSTRLKITGWFFWKLDFISNRCKVELVLRDNYNKCIYFETDKQFRQDVANALGNNACVTGFTCDIDYKDLNICETDYKIGIMITLPWIKKKKLCWTEQSVKRLSREAVLSAVDYRMHRLNESKESYTVLNYHIDSYDKETGKIKGWAINPSSMENDTDRYYVSYEIDGQKYAVDVLRHERIDIAQKYSHLPNVLRCGFESQLPEQFRAKVNIEDISVLKVDSK